MSARDPHSGAIRPAAFEPASPTPVTRRRRLRPWQVLVVVLLLLLTWLTWFTFTARSVRITTTPPEAQVEVAGVFSFDLGGVWLLRPGTVDLRVSAEGYHPLEVRREVDQAANQTWILALTPLPGIVDISSTPAGATVLLDGTAVGVTPIEALDVAAGEHALAFELPRHRPREELLRVTGRRIRQALEVALEPAWADVRLTSRPAGATLLVDGEPAGTTPLTAQIIEGQRVLALKLPRHKQWTARLDLVAGQQVALPAVQLEPADGLVLVQSTPPGAAVSVDGRFAGTSPVELELPPGEHRLALRLRGWQTLERSIRVDAEDDRRLDLTLQPNTGTVRVQVFPADATVTVNGRTLPPGTEQVDLQALPQTVRVSAPGHVAWEGSLLPRPGFTQQIRRRLLTFNEARLAAMTPTVTTGLGQVLVLVDPQGGSMTMGSSRREPGRRANEAMHEVSLQQPFYIGRHEVTNAEYRRFQAAHDPGEFEGVDLGDDNQPAVGLAWLDAVRYCNWLSSEDNLEPAYTLAGDQVTGFDHRATGYRLPTEAEWAWAARRQADGSMLRFPWGDAMPPPERVGNFADMSAGHVIGRIVFGYTDGAIASAPVGRYPANRLGLYDLGGNVAEWVHDLYAIPDGTPSTDPSGPERGEFRVIRGSSWMHGSMTDLRLAFRDYGTEGRNDLGFRLARTPDLPE